MKRDPHSEAVAREKASGLERKVSKMGKLLGQRESQLEKCHAATSRLLIENARLKDALTCLVGDYWMSYAAMPLEWCDFEKRDAVIEARATLATDREEGDT